MSSKRSKNELKEECRRAGLKVGGNKDDLIARLNGTEVAPSSGTKSGGGGGSSSRALSKPAVYKLLKEAGVEEPEHCSKCFLSAVSRRHITIDGPASLEAVIYSGGCHCCSNSIDCRVKDVLHQSDYGGDYEDGGEGGAVSCGDEDSGCGKSYLRGMCTGQFSYDSGKFHNHCTECPGFGRCIGDYRNSHCEHCGKHYFQGLSGFDCDCKSRGRKRGRGGGDFLDMLMGGWGMGMGGMDGDSEGDY